jgi:hypothetical protein
VYFETSSMEQLIRSRFMLNFHRAFGFNFRITSPEKRGLLETRTWGQFLYQFQQFCHDLLFSHIPKFMPITRRDIHRVIPRDAPIDSLSPPRPFLIWHHAPKPLDRPRPWSGYFTSIICNLDCISTRSHFNRDRISTMWPLFPTDSLVTGSHYYDLQYITLG